MEYYRQCLLGNGSTRIHTYIEERGAAVGKSVTLPDVEEPSGLWKVLSVADKRVPKQVITQTEQNARNHRKATDI